MPSESAVFLSCRFSLFLKDPFSRFFRRIVNTHNAEFHQGLPCFPIQNQYLEAVHFYF